MATRAVTTDTARRVLHAVAEALPDAEHTFVSRVEIVKGWGDVVNVRLRTHHTRSPQALHHWLVLRAGVEKALIGHRHRVELTWDSD